MKTFDSEFVEATYAKECNAVIVLWNKQVTDKGFKEAFIALLEIVKKQKATAYISEIKKQGIISPSSRQWLKEYIMPRAAKCGLKKVGTVLSEQAYQQIYMDNLSKHSANNYYSIEFQYFKSIGEAIRWVKEPVLL